MKKLCYYCEHFSYTTFHKNYSERTEGTDWDISCYKNIWKFNQKNNRETFAIILETAETCKDFVFYKEIEKLIKDKKEQDNDNNFPEKVK